MPSTSSDQQKAAGAALRAKREGKCDKAGAQSSREMCKSMNERQLREFSKKKK